LPIPKTFDSTVQAAYQFYCQDSQEFKKRDVDFSEALFSWPEGKGAGVWALNRDNARQWIIANRASLPNRILKT
jgi:hypothetical protein